MNPVQFLKEVRKELKKVSWPKRAEIVKMTGLVILISIVVGIYIGAIDLALTQVIERLL